MNFHYAAFTYLYEWVCYDRHYMKALEFVHGASYDSERTCSQLAAMAEHYQVIRNFKVQLNETKRLSPVWEVLVTMSKPNCQTDAIDSVKELVERLKPTYEHGLVSAASKILWFRFGHPIVIYDSLTVEALRQWGCPKYPAYDEFYHVWQTQFSKQEDEIRAVCGRLSGLSGLIEFLDDCNQKDLEEAMLSDWFRGRVFDHALMNYALERRAETDHN